MARNSKAEKVRKMLSEGIPPKEIARRVGVKPQNVYNIKYQTNKKQGIGALPKPPLIKNGIVTARHSRQVNAYIPSVDEFMSPDAERITRQAESAGNFWLWAILLTAATVVGVVIATV